jgi:pyrimidine operon attenuation protein/uracil phosphoribosyltransferase
MAMNNEPETEYTVVMDTDAMSATIRSIALAVANANPDIESLVMLGILRRGRPLAERIAGLIGELTGYSPPVGSLSTTMYRDDLHAGASGELASRMGETHFEFSVDDRTVLLVDDVLAAGRTIRAAMDEVMDYGRPRRIQLACLVDRGCRELPIQADYLGYSLATKPGEWVCVRLEETDGEDAVLVHRRFTAPDKEGN